MPLRVQSMAVLCAALLIQAGWFFYLRDLKRCAEEAYRQALDPEGPALKQDFGYTRMLHSYEVVWDITDPARNRVRDMDTDKVKVKRSTFDMVLLGDQDSLALYNDIRKQRVSVLLVDNAAYAVRQATKGRDGSIVVSCTTAPPAQTASDASVYPASVRADARVPNQYMLGYHAKTPHVAIIWGMP
jgi:hypothetical protein